MWPRNRGRSRLRLIETGNCSHEIHHYKLGLAGRGAASRARPGEIRSRFPAESLPAADRKLGTASRRPPHWGGIGGTSFDSKGHLWAFERCGGANCIGSDVAPIIELDTATGQPLKMFGSGLFVIPHAIFVDKNDHDNIWVVDQGAHEDKGEQVWKFSPDGKVLLTLGKPGQKGETPDTFNDPCSVITGKNGDIFVSDGHVGRDQKVARILKFSKDGKFIKTWGKKGTDPGDLDDPHSIVRCSAADWETNATSWPTARRPAPSASSIRTANYSTSGSSSAFPVEFLSTTRTRFMWARIFCALRLRISKRGIRIGGARDGKVTAFIIESRSGS